MPQKLIDGVRTKQLSLHADERGRLLEIVRADDDMFIKFGQVYLTTAYPGVVKGWHFHKRQTDSMAVIRGMMKIVLYDAREDSPTRGLINEFFVGDWNPMLVQIPAGVCHGFKCVSDHEALVINTVTEVYDCAAPDEYRLDPHTSEIPYDWARKDG
ncbi:MAG: dTDP-4-dehydrorhamnose 3,5-epimerase family protein [bacterium]|nr:dTDP-4-dehydrorhamnose 3,5-epimerase family protein [Candidatus Sumerlaeota bacterium]